MSAPLRVLVVDDDDDIREVAVLSLQLDPGIEARDFDAAKPAIDFLRSTTWRPDVVLLDLMMAGIDGLTALALIRELPGCATLPIIFVTARAREVDRAKLVAAGARAVLTKPFAPLELAADVRRLAGELSSEST